MSDVVQQPPVPVIVVNQTTDGTTVFAKPLPDNKPFVVSISKVLAARLTQGSPYERAESHFYQLEMSEPINNSIGIITDPLVPKWGRQMDGNPKMFVVDYRISQDRSAPQVYDLEVIYADHYTNAGLIRAAQNFIPVDNPLERPAIIEWSTYRTSEVIAKDLDGKPFTTTAGEPIIHSEEVERRVLHIRVNVVALPNVFGTGLSFTNVDNVLVNSPTGIPIKFDAYTLWLTDIRLGQEEINGGQFFYLLSFSCFHNPETWKVRKRNVGFMQLVPVQQFKPGQNGKKIPHGFRMTYMPIKVGNPPHFTRTPLPLRNTDAVDTFGNPLNGTLFPEYLAIDPTTGQQIDPTKVTLTPERLKAIWGEAEVSFITKQPIYFSSKAESFLGKKSGLSSPLKIPGRLSPIPDGIFFPGEPTTKEQQDIDNTIAEWRLINDKFEANTVIVKPNGATVLPGQGAGFF